MIAYVTPAEAIRHRGLRIVLVRNMPSPWGQAAKTIFEVKGLDYVAAPLELAGENAEIVAWAGENSAPVVAWADEKPLTRWNDILALAERLAPDVPLVPADPWQRVLAFGLGNEICGEGGIGWSRRLQNFHRAVTAGRNTGITDALIAKYGYDVAAASTASTRIAGSLNVLARQLEAQQARGVDFLVGDGLSAVDIYWTAFMNLLDPLPAEKCPMPEAARPGFKASDPEILAALTPTLVAHRDRIFEQYFRSPMEF